MTRRTRHAIAAVVLGLSWGLASYAVAEDAKVIWTCDMLARGTFSNSSGCVDKPIAIAWASSLRVIAGCETHIEDCERPTFKRDVPKNMAIQMKVFDPAHANKVLEEWFSGAVPVIGHCYALQVVDVAPGQAATSVSMQYVEQPCWVKQAVTQGRIPIDNSTGKQTSACMAGWCLMTGEK